MAKGKLITSSEAGTIFNMSKETVKKMVRRMNVAYGTSRGEYLFDRESFESSYLESQCRTYDAKKASAERKKKRRESGGRKTSEVKTAKAK